MAIQKFVTFNTLNKYEQIASKDCTISLKILENSGNYLIHKDILRHQILKKQGTSVVKRKLLEQAESSPSSLKSLLKK